MEQPTEVQQPKEATVTVQSTAARETGREHIPEFPPGWIVLRYLQLVFSVLVLFLAGCMMAMYWFWVSIYLMIASIATFVVCIWIIVAHYRGPEAYNYWAALVLDLFLWAFWGSSFGLGVASVDLYGEYYHSVALAVAIFICLLTVCLSVGFLAAWICDAVVIARHRRNGLGNKAVKRTPAQPVEV